MLDTMGMQYLYSIYTAGMLQERRMSEPGFGGLEGLGGNGGIADLEILGF
jgi:hypothetical protein